MARGTAAGGAPVPAPPPGRAQPVGSAGGEVHPGAGRGEQAAGPGYAGRHGAPPAASDAVAAVRALARASRMLEKASGGLALAHYRVLEAVAAGDERASGVARRLALGKPAISAAVEALCQRGLLVRGEVEGDQRAFALAVSDEGRRCLARSEEAMVDWLNRVCAPSGVSGAVLDGLCRLGEALDAASRGPGPTGSAHGACPPVEGPARP